VDETTEAETKKETVTDQENVSEESSEKKATVNLKKLEDFDYLRQTFYQVDNTTTIGKDQLDVDKLLGVDMTVDMETDGAQILIYHTHSQEGYKDSVTGDASTTVVGVGDYLTTLLEEKGFTVLHHKGEYDVGDRDHAYSNAAPAIEQLLKDNPSIQVVIDLHRDGVSENTRLVTEQNGKKMAKIMFFNGLSRTTAAGDIAYLKNPYIADNLAFSFQMQLAAAEYYPDLTRKIYLKGYRFNMHFCPKSMLVEVGAQTNTFEEAKNAMEPLADLLEKVLKE
jgi:stage II sporulation protein P